MALSSIVRRSASSLTPLAVRLLGGQRSFNHYCGGALFTAVNRTPKINSGNSILVPSFSRYCYSASPAMKRPSFDKSLLKFIDSEINCSENSYDEALYSFIPCHILISLGEAIPEAFPFKLNDNPGQKTVSFSREYKGETIHVKVEPSSFVIGKEDDDNDDDDDTAKFINSRLPMVVKVSKSGGLCLEFGITAYSNEIVINSLSVNNPDLAEDQVPYEGPKFNELDESLQEAMHKYLEIRGIKPSSTNFLHLYMVNKEHREYTNWLKTLKKFVKA